MNTDILFQNLLENPAFNTPVAEKTINEIKILDLRYTEEIDIIFMTSHVAKVKYGKKFNPNNSKQILSIIAPCFNYGGIIDKEGNILLTEELTKKIKEQTVEIGENSLISDSPNKIVDSLEKELETKTNQHEERNNQQLNLFNDLRERSEEISGNNLPANIPEPSEDGITGFLLPEERRESHRTEEQVSGSGRDIASGSGRDDLGRTDERIVRRTSKFHTPRGNKNNYVIPEKTQELQGNRFQYNLKVLEFLLEIEQEGREISEDEKAFLAGYSGFGGLAEILYDENSYAFQRLDKSTRESITSLMDVLHQLDPDGSKGVIESIKSSSLTAYYTPVEITRGIYDILEKVNYSRGTLLEPSIGTGIFMGSLSQKFKADSKLYGIEKDYITARIAQLLYPDTRIQNCGLETASIPNNYFDLVIGNIPFGDTRIYDSNWDKNANPIYKAAQCRIHNYFTVKMLEVARPGAILSFITTSATLDTPGNDIIRRYIHDHAEFLGAIRLHNKAFKVSNTEVVSDIIFLRKFKKKEEIKQSHEFIELSTKVLPSKNNYNNQAEVSYNQYFHDHPEMMIGNPRAGGQYSGETFTLLPPEPCDLREEIKKRGEAIISRKIQVGNTRETAPERKIPTKVEYASQDNIHVRPGNIISQDGKLGILEESFNDEYERVLVVKGLSKNIPVYQGEDFIQLRTILNRLMRAELENKPEEEINTERQALNSKYDSYVRRYGRLRDKKNRFIELDIDSFTILALEKYNKEGIFAGKADIFTRRTIHPQIRISKASSPQEAIAITLNEHGALNKKRLFELLGEDWEEITKDYIFELPDAPGEFETKEKYLSGNVKQKLAQAQAAADLDDRFKPNVTMLESVIPRDIPSSLITMNLGARWIPEEEYTSFFRELFEIPTHDEKGGRVFYNQASDLFHINDTYLHNEKIRTHYAAAGRDGIEIAEAAINDRSIKVYYKDEEGKNIFDYKGTQAVEEKIDKIKTAFSSWLMKDQERVQALGKKYNSLFNTDVLPQYDGSHLSFPGLQIVEPRIHQKNATWMQIQNQGGLVDHMVGAGKTLVAILTVMKLRETGLAKKVLFIALKPTVGDIALEFKRVYPLAKILAPSVNDFSEKNRKKILAQIAINDWDCVILTHDQYTRLGHANWVEQQVIKEELDLLQATIVGIDTKNIKSELDKRQLKSLEKRKTNLKAKLTEIFNRKNDDFCFENLGIDHLIVDESHMFKNLPYSTSHSQVAGLGDPTGSQKARLLLLGCRALQTLHQGDKGVTFLSGTPISNSMVELYLILRYLRPNKLKELGLNTFDAWASIFAKRSSEIEYTVTGELKIRERFREFVNVPEMAMLYAAIADVRNEKNLKLPKPSLNFNLIDIEPSKTQKWYMKEIISFVQNGYSTTLHLSGDNVKKAKGLLSSTLSAKVSMDPRLLDANNLDEDSSKVHQSAINIARIYHETEEYKGVQLVFSDIGTPSTGEFNVYDELKRKLTEEHGIPRDTIAYIHDASTDLSRLQLYDKVRSGIIRVLIGSSQKLGTGTNVQDRVIAIHQLDIPWTPTLFQQRNGRGGRQGNWLAPKICNNSVPVYLYALKQSLDTYKYQLIQIKDNFINQVRDGSIKERTFDEGADGENSMPLAEFIAILSGNPLILEKANVDKEIKKLYTSQRIFEEEGFYRKQKIANLKVRIEQIQEETNNAEKDIKHFIANGFGKLEDGTYNYNVTIDNIQYTKPSDAGAALLARVDEGRLGKAMEGYGVELYLAKTMSISGKVINYSVLAPSGYAYGNKNLSFDPTHAGMSIITAIEQAQRILEKKTQIPDLIKGLQDLEQNQTGEWEHLHELENLLKRQKEIAAKLEMVGKEVKPEVENKSETTGNKITGDTIALKSIKSHHLSLERVEVFKDPLITIQKTSLHDSSQEIWLAEIKKLRREEYIQIVTPLLNEYKGEWNRNLQVIVFKNKEAIKSFNRSIHAKLNHINPKSYSCITARIKEVKIFSKVNEILKNDMEFNISPDKKQRNRKGRKI